MEYDCNKIGEDYMLIANSFTVLCPKSSWRKYFRCHSNEAMPLRLQWKAIHVVF